MPSIYRVLAVAVAASATAASLFVVGVPLLVGVPLALVVWIGLAIVQEHDERVTLPVDAEFYAHLREFVDPVLAPHGLAFSSSFGPCRARGDRTEVFLYERPATSEGYIDLWIHRDRAEGTMRVDLAGRRLAQGLLAAGEERLAERVEQAMGSDEDVVALREALSVVPADFWE
ncbi:MAG: hypothetical protein AAGD35_19010 [Actinomycetota bacterium]